MKSFFENRTWPDEIEFWKYIQTIDHAPEGMPDGMYIIEMDSDISCIKFQEAFYFTQENKGEDFLYNREYTYTRITFRIKNGICYNRYFRGFEIIAAERRTANNEWISKYYKDLMFVVPPRPSTLEERLKAAACLGKLFEMKLKKAG